MKEPDAQFYFDEAERRFFIVVKHARQIHGIIEAGDFLFPKFINHYLNVALNLSNICGLMLTNIERHEESVKMALLDPLTGIYNWRYATGYYRRRSIVLREREETSLSLCWIFIISKL